MYGPVASKVALTIIIVLGLGTFFGFQFAFVDSPPIDKEVISLIVFVFGVGAAWATVKGDIKAIRAEVKSHDDLVRSDMNIKFAEVDSKIKLVKMRYENLASRVDSLAHRSKRSRASDREDELNA